MRGPGTARAVEKRAVETSATPERDDAKKLWEALERHGVLLVHDVELPSATRVVAGEPVHGSWWGHPAGGRIFSALEALEARGVLAVPLVRLKATLLHPRLVPALVATCRAHEAWQRAGLDRAGRALLAEIDAAGELRTSTLAPARRPLGKKLASSLLCASRQEHTERGAHGTVLESWPHLGARTGHVPLPTAALGRRALEEAVAGWAGDARLLPWQTAR